jgi:hypothetical protein
MPAFSRWEPTPDEAAALPARRYRYHCCVCGRFVPFATVRIVPHWQYGYVSEQDTRGDCSACGSDVDVVWGAG